MFEERLKKLRESKKMTQSELSNALNIGRASVSNYELGNRTPDIDTLVKIANYFNVTTDYLTGRSDQKTIEEECNYIKLNNSLKLDENIDKTKKERIIPCLQKIVEEFDLLAVYDKKLNSTVNLMFYNCLLALIDFFDKAREQLVEPLSNKEYTDILEKKSRERHINKMTTQAAIPTNELESLILNKEIATDERQKLNALLNEFETSAKIIILRNTKSDLFSVVVKALQSMSKEDLNKAIEAANFQHLI